MWALNQQQHILRRRPLLRMPRVRTREAPLLRTPDSALKLAEIFWRKMVRLLMPQSLPCFVSVLSTCTRQESAAVVLWLSTVKSPIQRKSSISVRQHHQRQTAVCLSTIPWLQDLVNGILIILNHYHFICTFQRKFHWYLKMKTKKHISHKSDHFPNITTNFNTKFVN